MVVGDIQSPLYVGKLDRHPRRQRAKSGGNYLDAARFVDFFSVPQLEVTSYLAFVQYRCLPEGSGGISATIRTLTFS